MPANNKRIAKNTIMLYIRMFLMMAVAFYTSRVVLKVLGVDDYGIYNLISGFVTVFSFVNKALVSATQRYLNVALGKQDDDLFTKIYSMSINIYLLLSAIILLVGETVGLWFINTQLNISPDRMFAARWVYQFALFMFVFRILRTPYNAAVVAHEKMDFYAYISIVEAVLQLLIVFLIQNTSLDKLIVYAALMLATVIIITVVYRVYCTKEFNQCLFRLFWDKSLFKELLGFSGWSLLGQIAVIGRTQGENFLINHYFTVAANAARGVATQASNATHMFVTNFQTAFNPQLTKTYAAGESKDHLNLLFRSSKWSYFLMLIVMLPVAFNVEALLGVWLEEVPEFTASFCVLGLISYLVMALSSPITTSIFAHGQIRNYQIALCVVFFIGLLLSFLALKMGLPPYSVSGVSIIVQIMMLLVRLYYAKKMVKLRLREYFSNVLLPVGIVTVVSLTIPFVLHIVDKNNLWMTFLYCIADMLWGVVIVYLLGLNRTEKRFVSQTIENLKHKIIR